MNQVNLPTILEKTVSIPPKRHYWLVRTMSGDYYSDYLSNHFIAIGFDSISLKDIWAARQQGENAQKYLSELIKNRYEKTDQNVNYSYAAAQLLRFCYKIQEGDIVVVPGRSNDRRVTIGIVEGKPFEELNKKAEAKTDCPFYKRIKVKWCGKFLRNELNPVLQLIFNSRHIVSNIDDYAQYIDSTIYNFYQKGNITYLVLTVKTHEDIPSNDFMFIGDVLTLLSDYMEEQNIEMNINDIRMKACVQSPGDIILFATSGQGICLIGLIILLLNGGTFKIEKFGLDLSSKGILKNLSEFLDRRRDRKQIKALCKKLENLRIEDPKDLLDILKKLKNPREKY